MAGPWHLSFCVLLISPSICFAIYLQEKQEQQMGVSTRTRVPLGNGLKSSESEILGRGRVKRKTVVCPVLETKGEGGLERIIDAKAETAFNFFIQPQPGFKSLEFRAKMKSKLSLKCSRKSLVVSSSQIEIDLSHPTWIPVKIEYFKAKISWAPDRHALSVKVGKNVNEELITCWWRTNSYEGFTVEAEGPLKFLLKCNPWSPVAEPVVDGKDVKRTVLIACILVSCFLLILGTATLYLLIAVRSRSQQDNQNDSPPVPTSLLRGRRVKRDDDSNNIYESIDEDTLAKLRQNLDADTLALGRTECVKGLSRGSAKCYENTKATLDSTVRPPCHLSGFPSGNGRNKLAISLLEEKEALRECSDLNSPVESHYIEMHGIVSRTSSLNK